MAQPSARFGAQPKPKDKKDISLLEDVDLSVESTDAPLVLIFGPVGSYKSSLLTAILGEMARVRGDIECVGSVAYVQQNPFILEGTIKANITFGKEYNKAFYDETIWACRLYHDINQLRKKDETMLGERGVNLSVGQKMRVCLARAVYADADIYLIDNALASVDVRQADIVFNEVILGMLGGKIRLVVTNHLEYAEYADKIMFMDNPVKDTKTDQSSSLGHNKVSAGSTASAKPLQQPRVSTSQLVRPPRLSLNPSVERLSFAWNQSLRQGFSWNRTPLLFGHARSNRPTSGRVAEVGTYEELIASPTSNLKSMLDDCAESMHAVEPDLAEPPAILCRESGVWGRSRDNGHLHSPNHVHGEATGARGRLNARVFCVYAKAMGVWLWVLVVVAYVGSEVLRVLLDICLTAWSDDSASYLGIPHLGNRTANLSGM